MFVNLFLLRLYYECQVIRPLAFDEIVWNKEDEAHRKAFVLDLVTNVLPGKHRVEIEELLGASRSYENMRRYRPSELRLIRIGEDGKVVIPPPTGEGHYLDEYEWDLIYDIGPEKECFSDTFGFVYSTDREELILRCDKDGYFESWYVHGSHYWQFSLNERARASYRPTRQPQQQ
jgi:hypothetical protein